MPRGWSHQVLESGTRRIDPGLGTGQGASKRGWYKATCLVLGPTSSDARLHLPSSRQLSLTPQIWSRRLLWLSQASLLPIPARTTLPVTPSPSSEPSGPSLTVCLPYWIGSPVRTGPGTVSSTPCPHHCPAQGGAQSSHLVKTVTY